MKLADSIEECSDFALSGALADWSGFVCFGKTFPQLLSAGPRFFSISPDRELPKRDGFRNVPITGNPQSGVYLAFYFFAFYDGGSASNRIWFRLGREQVLVGELLWRCFCRKGSIVVFFENFNSTSTRARNLPASDSANLENRGPNHSNLFLQKMHFYIGPTFERN